MNKDYMPEKNVCERYLLSERQLQVAHLFRHSDMW